MLRKYLAPILIFSLVSLSSCASLYRSSLPKASKSANYEVFFAGFDWEPEFRAKARFGLIRTSDTPKTLYIKSYLPEPDGSLSKPITRIVRQGKGSELMFLGSERTGWRGNQIYKFYLEVFSDPGYKNRIDSISQDSVCIIPQTLVFPTGENSSE